MNTETITLRERMKIEQKGLEKCSKYEQVKRKKGSANKKKQENAIICVSVPNLFLNKTCRNINHWFTKYYSVDFEI